MGQTFINSVVGQSDFLISLALAVSGSCVWLIVWIAQKRLSNEAVALEWVLALAIAIVLAAGSLLFALFGRGQLISSIGEIHSVTNAKEFSALLNSDSKVQGLAEILMIQMTLLAGSVFAVSCFALRNAGLLMKRTPKTKRKGKT
ncbi:hypothetical protein [Terrihabitans soli]|nr:hypothetical protein [Terrihabitans soli]